MDNSEDRIRRQAQGLEADHQVDLHRHARALDHLATSDGAVLGGVHRRQVLMFGGVAVASAAVFAACKGPTPPLSPTPATTTTTLFHQNASDVVIMRTAASIEELLVTAYTKILATNLVTDAVLLDLVKLFQSQHSQHADLFGRATRSAGGVAFTDPNPVLMQQVLQPRLAALSTEADVMSLAYDLEHLSSATCQAELGTFSNLSFNTTVGSVGATEARHVALLAILTAKSATGTPDNAFQMDPDAVKSGTGV